MVERLLHNWNGYVRLRLHGYSPERFLNLCNARRLEVWGLICNRDGDYEFYMTVKGIPPREASGAQSAGQAAYHRPLRCSFFYL